MAFFTQKGQIMALIELDDLAKLAIHVMLSSGDMTWKIPHGTSLGSITDPDNLDGLLCEAINIHNHIPKPHEVIRDDALATELVASA